MVHADETRNQGMLGLDNSNLTVDHGYFDHNIIRRIRSRDSSLIVRNSFFTEIYPGITCPNASILNNISEHLWGGGIPAGGHFIIENNVFGPLHRPQRRHRLRRPARRRQPLAQILGNTFLGTGDDDTDMSGNIYMEGNRFLNGHKDACHDVQDPGNSNINSSSFGDYWSTRNIYYNIDHATITKEDAFTTFENNTVVSGDFAAIYFDLAGQTAGPGRGAAVDGTIFYDTPLGVRRGDSRRRSFRSTARSCRRRPMRRWASAT